MKIVLVAGHAALCTLADCLCAGGKMSFLRHQRWFGRCAISGPRGGRCHLPETGGSGGSMGRCGRPTCRPRESTPRTAIGAGPWVNAKGVEIAKDVASLHSDANAISKDTALRRLVR